jgi:plasmid stability protein
MMQINLSQLDPSLLEKLKTLAQKHNRSLEEEIESLLENQVQEIEVTPSNLAETSNQGENNPQFTQSSVRDEGGFGCARNLIVIPSDFDEPLEEFSEYV